MKATTARRFPIKKIVSGAALFLFAAMLAALPRQCAAACAEGIALWAKAVLPSLLPFLAVSTLLAARGRKAADRLAPLMRRVKLPAPASLCLLLSVLSGYPVGSRAVAELAERGGIPHEGVLRTAVLCSTSGPMFLLGTVGGMYADPAAGAVLFASHLAGVFLVCLLLLPFAKKLPESPPHEKQEESIPSLGESVQRAVLSVLCVGGFVALFYVLGEMLAALGALRALTAALSVPLAPFGAQPLAEGLAYGLLEATHGCAALASAGGPLALPLTAFVVTFGGGSILAQQLSFLSPAGVKAPLFVAVKAAQGAAAFSVCLLLARVFL